MFNVVLINLVTLIFTMLPPDLLCSLENSGAIFCWNKIFERLVFAPRVFHRVFKFNNEHLEFSQIFDRIFQRESDTWKVHSNSCKF